MCFFLQTTRQAGTSCFLGLHVTGQPFFHQLTYHGGNGDALSAGQFL